MGRKGVFSLRTTLVPFVVGQILDERALRSCCAFKICTAFFFFACPAPGTMQRVVISTPTIRRYKEAKSDQAV